jgi:PTS system N-acetylglucosamine-specific IIC component
VLGREQDEGATPAVVAGKSGEAPGWIRALGEAANLRAVEACTTRLRLTVVDPDKLDEPALKALGSRGVLKLADNAVQVVVGPIADQLAAEIRATLRAGGAATAAVTAPTPASAAASPSRVPNRGDSSALLAAFGGGRNLASVEARSTRVLIEVKDAAAVNEPAVISSGFRGAARASDRVWHVIVGPDAASVALALRQPH